MKAVLAILAVTSLLAGCASYNDYRPNTGATGPIDAPPVRIDNAGQGMRDGLLTARSARYHHRVALATAISDPETPSRQSWSLPKGERGYVRASEPFLSGATAANGDVLIVPLGLTTDFILDPLSAQARAKTGVNVRVGPGTGYDKVTTIAKGTVVDILGQVPGRKWVLVAQGEEGLGYMFRPLLEVTGGRTAARRTSLRSGENTSGILDLTDANPNAYSAQDVDLALAGGDGDTSLRLVLCRSVEQSVSHPRNGYFEWEAVACRIKPGRWRLFDRVPRAGARGLLN